eukprot:g78866.t1
MIKIKARTPLWIFLDPPVHLDSTAPIREKSFVFPFCCRLVHPLSCKKMATLASIFSRQWLNNVAVISPELDHQCSYKELQSHVQRLQKAFANMGLGAGDVVSMAIPNGLEYVVIFLAATMQACTAGPLNPNYTLEEFKFFLTDAKSKLLVVPRGWVSQKQPAVQAAQELNVPVAEAWWGGNGLVLSTSVPPGAKVPVRARPVPLNVARPEDVALLLHTSGTTGTPKGVPLKHKNMVATMNNIVRTYALTGQDRSYLVMPLFHVHGLMSSLLGALNAGGSVVIPRKFSASVFWEQFSKYKCTWYSAVPTIHQILLASPIPKPVPPIRFIRSCSSSLSPVTFQQLEAAFHAPVLEAYAMTEAAHQMTSNPLPKSPRKPGSVGVGQGVLVRTLHPDKEEDVPEGEVCVKGPNVFDGYLNNPKANKESFTENGWFRTGDQGRLDTDGYLFLTGRIKELINRGGEKISPLEIDAALLAVPGVAEAVSFGVPDEMYGQQVAAVVVLKPGAQLSSDDVRKALQSKLASFKVPMVVYFSKTMPKTASGKIQRRKMVGHFWDKDPNKGTYGKQQPKAKL